MFSKNNLQKRLLTSVFIIVAFIIFSVTALVTWFEKQRYQQMEFDRIFYEVQAIKGGLGHLMAGSDRHYLKVKMSDIKSTNPSILYFTLTDMNGEVLVSDAGSLLGEAIFEIATIKDLSTPVFQSNQIGITGKTSCRFEIFQAYLNRDILVTSSKIALSNSL